MNNESSSDGEYYDEVMNHGCNIQFVGLPNDSPIQNLNIENNNVLDQLRNDQRINDDRMTSVGKFISSFGNKHELHQFMQINCNFVIDTEDKMRVEYQGQLICNFVKVLKHHKDMKDKLQFIKGISYKKDLKRECEQDGDVEPQLCYTWTTNQYDQPIKKYQDASRQHQIKLLTTLKHKDWYLDKYKVAEKNGNLDKKMKIQNMKVTARKEFADNIEDFKSKFSKPGRIGKCLSKAMQHNQLIKHSNNQRAAQLAEQKGRKKMGSALDVRMFVRKNEIRNENINLDNIPKDQLQRMIERRDEQLSANDPKQTQSENFADIVGTNVDYKMHQLYKISLLLDSLRQRNASRLELMAASVQELEVFQEFLNNLKNDIDSNFSDIHDRVQIYDQICNLIDAM